MNGPPGGWRDQLARALAAHLRRRYRVEVTIRGGDGGYRVRVEGSAQAADGGAVLINTRFDTARTVRAMLTARELAARARRLVDQYVADPHGAAALWDAALRRIADQPGVHIESSRTERP